MDRAAALMMLLCAGGLTLAGLRQGRGYEAFLKGAEEGLETGWRLLPALTAMVLLVDLVHASGLASMAEGMLGPVAERFGFPREALMTALLRPLSGAGSLAALEELMMRLGPDSRPARVAAVLVGSSETILYTMTVYLSAAGVRHLPRALSISMLSWMAGAAAACWLC